MPVGAASRRCRASCRIGLPAVAGPAVSIAGCPPSACWGALLHCLSAAVAVAACCTAAGAGGCRGPNLRYLIVLACSIMRCDAPGHRVGSSDTGPFRAPSSAALPVPAAAPWLTCPSRLGAEPASPNSVWCPEVYGHLQIDSHVLHGFCYVLSNHCCINAVSMQLTC